MEESIRLPIFGRKKKPVGLTDAGKIYIEPLEKMMLLELEEQQRINDIKELRTGTIRIGGTHYINSYILPPFLVEFSRRYPNITLEIVERSAFELRMLLDERKIDLTFSCREDDMKELPYYPFFEDNIIFAVPLNDEFNMKHADAAMNAEDIVMGRHLYPSVKKLSIGDIADKEIILLGKGNNLHERVLSMYAEAGIEVKVKLKLNQLVTAFHYAEAGYGATFTSDRLVRKFNNTLVFYPIESAVANRQFNILLPLNSYVPIAVEKLIELLTGKG